jgi:hypothetical protein
VEEFAEVLIVGYVYCPGPVIKGGRFGEFQLSSPYRPVIDVLFHFIEIFIRVQEAWRHFTTGSEPVTADYNNI